MKLEKEAKIGQYTVGDKSKLTLKVRSAANVNVTTSKLTFFKNQSEKYVIKPSEDLINKTLVVTLEPIEEKDADEESLQISIYKTERRLILPKRNQDRVFYRAELGHIPRYADSYYPDYEIELPLTKEEFEELKKLPPGTLMRPSFKIK